LRERAECFAPEDQERRVEVGEERKLPAREWALENRFAVLPILWQSVVTRQ
jgi:hypothetical protein